MKGIELENHSFCWTLTIERCCLKDRNTCSTTTWGVTVVTMRSVVDGHLGDQFSKSIINNTHRREYLRQGHCNSQNTNHMCIASNNDQIINTILWDKISDLTTLVWNRRPFSKFLKCTEWEMKSKTTNSQNVMTLVWMRIREWVERGCVAYSGSTDPRNTRDKYYHWIVLPISKFFEKPLHLICAPELFLNKW